MPVIEQVHDEFARIFGRHYPHCVEEYLLDGAEVAFVISGWPRRHRPAAIRHMRERGAKVGHGPAAVDSPVPDRTT